MNRVSLINLAGRAYHVEEDGVVAISAWLAAARERLAGDPDRDELLLDFERAIAERCDAAAPRPRDVVSTAAARELLAALGEVEPASAPEADPEAVEGERPRGEQAQPRWRARKLYRLDGADDRMIAGVCAGIAAYLNIDVTIVRLVAVLLAFASHGGVVVAYLVLMLVLPKADTPAKRAQARGGPDTAQEIIRHAREQAGPALQSAGVVVLALLRGSARAAQLVALSAIWVVVSAWAVQVAWVFINGGGLTSAFDGGTSAWWVALWVSCLAWLVLGGLLAIRSVSIRLADDPGERPRNRTRDAAAGWVAGAATIAAIIGLVAIPAEHSAQMAQLGQGHARVRAYAQTWCITLDDRADAYGPGCTQSVVLD